MRKKRTVLQFPLIEVNGETLTYSRVAHKAKDGTDGLLFVHTWATGFQELIFQSYDSAKRWLAGHVKVLKEQA